MYDYYLSNRLFHPNMHAYRRNKFPQTALLNISNWKNQCSGIVLLDLSCAFDLVKPDILLRLNIYGVDKDFCAWIKSYLEINCFKVTE